MSSHDLDTSVVSFSGKTVGRSTKRKQSSTTAETRRTKRSPSRRKVSRTKFGWLSPRNALIGTTLALLGLSLTHLADGIVALTHCPTWQAIAMSIGIDLMFVSVEWLILTDAEAKAKVHSEAMAITTVTIAVSSVLNGLAFYTSAPEQYRYAAAAFGAAIPALIYYATQILAKSR